MCKLRHGWNQLKHWSSHWHHRFCSPTLPSPQVSTSPPLEVASLIPPNAGEVNPMSVQVQQFASVKAVIFAPNVWESTVVREQDVVGTRLLLRFIRDCKEWHAPCDMYWQALYNSGARKAVVFGVGPVGCSPFARASNPTNPGECLDEANRLALGINAGLKQLVDGLRVALPEFTLVLANIFDTVTAMIADGKPFGTLMEFFFFWSTGLDNVNAACCGAGFLNAEVQCGKPVPSTLPGAVADFCKRASKSLFWDVLHPSEVVVRTLFNLVFTGDATVAYTLSI